MACSSWSKPSLVNTETEKIGSSAAYCASSAGANFGSRSVLFNKMIRRLPAVSSSNCLSSWVNPSLWLRTSKINSASYDAESNTNLPPGSRQSNVASSQHHQQHQQHSSFAGPTGQETSVDNMYPHSSGGQTVTAGGARHDDRERLTRHRRVDSPGHPSPSSSAIPRPSA